MKNSFVRDVRIYLVILITVPFMWAGYAVADHHGSGQGHSEGDGHSHSKKKKKSKKHKSKNHKHKHKKGHNDDDGHGHHDDEDDHAHGDDDHDHDHDNDDGHGHTKKKKKGGHSHDDSEYGAHEDNDEGDHGDHGGHDEHGSDSFGEGKAIVEVQNEGESFRLADEAQSLMGLKYSVVQGARSGENFVVPNEAIVYFNDEKGIFVKEGQWFELVDVKVVKKGSSRAVIESEDLSRGQRIVVAGTGLLRVAHLQASGQGGKGHAH